MLDFNEYFKYSIICFLVLGVVLWTKKPSIMFDSDGKMLPFGTGKNKTVFYYPFVVLVMSIIIFFCFNLLFLRKGL